MFNNSGMKARARYTRCWQTVRFIGLAACLMVVAGTHAEPREPVVLVIGDSLSAGYGISRQEGWVYLLQQRLAAEEHPHKVVNASISGDTSRGGSARLGLLLNRFDIAVAVVELGGNDGLRGLDLSETQKHLDDIIMRLQAAGAKVLLVGMQIPPNLGPRYTSAFKDLFPKLARDRHTALVPFLLQDVAIRPELMQRDGIHPVAAAQPQLLDNVWRYLQPLL